MDGCETSAYSLGTSAFGAHAVLVLFYSVNLEQLFQRPDLFERALGYPLQMFLREIAEQHATMIDPRYGHQ
ncbi:MAG: hypothetical protein ACLSBB_14590 [Ruthenibacterium lactatiformans]